MKKNYNPIQTPCKNEIIHTVTLYGAASASRIEINCTLDRINGGKKEIKTVYFYIRSFCSGNRVFAFSVSVTFPIISLPKE